MEEVVRKIILNYNVHIIAVINSINTKQANLKKKKIKLLNFIFYILKISQVFTHNTPNEKRNVAL